jgi:Ca2+-binding RTX toxin-like protein
VRLNTQPTANVTVAITPESQVTVSLRALTFTPANWNVAQTVTVTAVDDAVVEGNHVSPISHATTSTDTLYNNLVAPLTVNISDNDNLGDVTTLFQKSVIGFTQKDDRVTGSPLNDMIHARPGNDYLHGKAGDDLLYGQKGHDGIRGGDGNDIIFGGKGIDFISGDRGIDLIYSVRETIAFTGAMATIYCLATGAMTTYVEKSVPTLSQADWVLMCLRSRSALVQQA